MIADLTAWLAGELRESQPSALRRAAVELLIEDTRARVHAGPTGIPGD